LLREGAVEKLRLGNGKWETAQYRSRLMSDASIPPYLAFHLKYVAVEMPVSRHTSPTVRPPSTAFNTPSTCLSIDFDRFIRSSFFILS
jgi:hypothetical protein